MVLVIVMPSVLMISNGLMVKLIWRAGIHHQMIQMLDRVIMEPVVMKWIFGKLIQDPLKSHLILVLYKDNIDVKVLTVEIIQTIDMMDFVIKMVVISILIDLGYRISLEKVIFTL